MEVQSKPNSTSMILDMCQMIPTETIGIRKVKNCLSFIRYMPSRSRFEFRLYIFKALKYKGYDTQKEKHVASNLETILGVNHTIVLNISIWQFL